MSMEILAPNEQELRARRDFTRSIKTVGKALRGCPGETLSYLALTILESIYPSFRLASALEALVMVYITRKVIQTTYLEYINAADSAPKLPPAPIKRLIGLEILWSIGTGVLTVCLIVPGLWFAISGALAQQFVVIDDAKAIESISKSNKLIKGHFWKLLVYSLLWPGIIVLILLACAITSSVFLPVLMPAENPLLVKNITTAVTTLNVLASAYLVLCSTALATRMFGHLMRKNGTQTLVEKRIAAQSLPLA